MTGRWALLHHILRTTVRESNLGRFGTELELTVGRRPLLAWLQVTPATRASWPATQLVWQAKYVPIR